VLSDISSRAREVAELTASLNGIDNVELRTGDWFEPVAGERFDIAAANLPYGFPFTLLGDPDHEVLEACVVWRQRRAWASSGRRS
jgi:methylase of polypeptide subunit release factors